MATLPCLFLSRPATVLTGGPVDDEEVLSGVEASFRGPHDSDRIVKASAAAGLTIVGAAAVREGK